MSSHHTEVGDALVDTSQLGCSSLHEQLLLEQCELLWIHNVAAELPSELSCDLVWDLWLPLSSGLAHTRKRICRELHLATQDSLVLLFGYLIVHQGVSQCLLDGVLVLLR